jgi:hypothetical protein
MPAQKETGGCEYERDIAENRSTLPPPGLPLIKFNFFLPPRRATTRHLSGAFVMLMYEGSSAADVDNGKRASTCAVDEIVVTRTPPLQERLERSECPLGEYDNIGSYGPWRHASLGEQTFELIFPPWSCDVDLHVKGKVPWGTEENTVSEFAQQ